MSNPSEVRGSTTLIRREGPRPHQSTTETRERHYERCREAGIPAENARKIAGEATERNHREWDRRGRSE